MGTPEQFARELEGIILSIEPNTASVVRRVTTQLLEDCVRGTPVDKGVARSNWRVSLATPSTNVLSAYAPGQKLGIGETANAGAAIAAGSAVIRGINAQNVEGTVTVSNPVGYINDLRRGSSKQQPVDWVSIALARAQTSLRLTNILKRGPRR